MKKRTLSILLILIMVVCFSVAASYPVKYFRQKESNETDMDALRAMRMAALENSAAMEQTSAEENHAGQETPPTGGSALTDAAVGGSADNAETQPDAAADAQPAQTETNPDGDQPDEPTPLPEILPVVDILIDQETDKPEEPNEQTGEQEQTSIATIAEQEETSSAATAEPAGEDQTPAAAAEPAGEDQTPIATAEPAGEKTPAATAEPAGEETPAATAEPAGEDQSPEATAEPAGEDQTPITTAEPAAETPAPTEEPVDRHDSEGYALAYSNKDHVQFDESKLLPQYRDIYDLNNDLVGWLTIPGTDIDYPVVRNEDPDFYLDRDFFGETNSNGQLIMDSACDPWTPSYNLVVSGHNMKSGAMFAQLVNYKSRSFWEKHKTFTFDSVMREGTYVVFAAFYSADYAEDEEGFRYNADIQYRLDAKLWLEDIAENCEYDTGIDVEFGDEFLTLTTCQYHRENGRFVVVARRVREGEVIE